MRISSTSRSLNFVRSLSLSSILVVSSLASSAFAQVTVGSVSQVTVNTSGGIPSGQSRAAAIGANGKMMAFESSASNLTSGDANGVSDIFIRDLRTGGLTVASVNTAGGQGNQRSEQAAISLSLTNGFFAVAFASLSNNLGSLSPFSAIQNIFVRLPTLGITEIVSAGSGFSVPDGDSRQPSVALVTDKSGRNKIIVAFTSDATNLITTDNNRVTDIFLAQFTAPTSTSYNPSDLVSVSRIPQVAVVGQEPNGPSDSPNLSSDGRYVVFSSRATNILTDRAFNQSQPAQIYRYDTQTGVTILVSHDSSGVEGDASSFAPVVNYNGRYVAYLTNAANLVSPAGQSESVAVVRYDTVLGTSERVNVSTTGVAGLGIFPTLSMSANGRLIAFADFASLIPTDTNSFADVYVKDMLTGAIAIASPGTSSTQSDGDSFGPVIAGDALNSLAHSVAYESYATNLTNPSFSSQTGDIFQTSATVPTPPLSSTTTIETPPDVTVRSRTLTFSAQQFTLSGSSATLNAAKNSNAAREAAGSLIIRYEFEVVRHRSSNGGIRTVRENLRAKNNSITVSKRARTEYLVRARLLTVRRSTNKTIRRTPWSPRAQLKVK